VRVGFVGLGNMGRPIASHVLAAGHALAVWDVAPGAVDALAQAGASAATDLGVLAAASDVVFLSLPGPPEVDAVVVGERGLLGTLASGAVVVDLSTNSVAGARRLAGAAAERGVSFLDAPVSGGKAGAEAGTLSTMVGGAPEAFEAVRPLLDCFAAKVFHVGPAGAGALAKLVNNQIFLCASVLVQEGFVLGARAGMDPADLLEILKASSAASVVGAAPMFLRRAFDDVTFKLSIAEKDVAVALDSADELGVSMPTTAAALGVYRDAIDRGLADKVFTATLLALEARAGVEVPVLRRREAPR
jgi:3-hydroxyisobutyrate dehydrogenase-like beta-hydroxyacid dehydrogenase